MERSEYLNKFRRCILEYTNVGESFNVNEDGEDEQMPQGGDPNAMGGDPNAMGGGDMMGGDPNAAGDNPNAMGGSDMMGGDPNVAGGNPNAMGGDPNAMGGEAPAQGPEGFAPQGQEEPMMPDNAESDEEVIDVDDLTDSQEDTEKKIDALTDKFEMLMSKLDSFESQIDSSNGRMENLRAEIEKRNPTPVEKMSLRSAKSGPFSVSPEEYWANNAPENYSPEDDNNGADDPQYQITKADIDNISDWQSIYKSLDDDHMGLKDILGY